MTTNITASYGDKTATVRVKKDETINQAISRLANKLKRGSRFFTQSNTVTGPVYGTLVGRGGPVLEPSQFLYSKEGAL
jgi:hypothetical protein